MRNYIWVAMILCLTSCGKNAKTIFHDNFTDYTVSNSVAELRLPPGVALQAQDTYYKVPDLPKQSQSRNVSLYPPGSKLAKLNKVTPKG